MRSDAAPPATLPISLSAIFERLRPLCLTDAKSTIMSWTAPASTQPDDDPEGSGQEPELCSKRPDPGAERAAAIASEMMTVQNEFVGFYIVDPIRTGLCRCRTDLPADPGLCWQ